MAKKKSDNASDAPADGINLDDFQPSETEQPPVESPATPAPPAHEAGYVFIRVPLRPSKGYSPISLHAHLDGQQAELLSEVVAGFHAEGSPILNHGAAIALLLDLVGAAKANL